MDRPAPSKAKGSIFPAADATAPVACPIALSGFVKNDAALRTAPKPDPPDPPPSPPTPLVSD